MSSWFSSLFSDSADILLWLRKLECSIHLVSEIYTYNTLGINPYTETDNQRVWIIIVLPLVQVTSYMCFDSLGLLITLVIVEIIGRKMTMASEFLVTMICFLLLFICASQWVMLIQLIQYVMAFHLSICIMQRTVTWVPRILYLNASTSEYILRFPSLKLETHTYQPLHFNLLDTTD